MTGDRWQVTDDRWWQKEGDRWQVVGVMSHVTFDKWHVASATCIRCPLRAPEFATCFMHHRNCNCGSKIMYRSKIRISFGKEDPRVIKYEKYFKKWKKKYQPKGITHYRNSGALRGTLRKWHLPHVKCHLSSVTSDMTPVTCHMSPVTIPLSPVKCHLSPVCNNRSHSNKPFPC